MCSRIFKERHASFAEENRDGGTPSRLMTSERSEHEGDEGGAPESSRKSNDPVNKHNGFVWIIPIAFRFGNFTSKSHFIAQNFLACRVFESSFDANCSI